MSTAQLQPVPMPAMSPSKVARIASMVGSTERWRPRIDVNPISRGWLVAGGDVELARLVATGLLPVRILARSHATHAAG